jgi:hypothetical protein
MPIPARHAGQGTNMAQMLFRRRSTLNRPDLLIAAANGSFGTFLEVSNPTVPID